MIRHILLIQFKSTVTSEQINSVATRFRKLPDDIKGVRSVDWGENNSPEGLNKEYSHAAIITFADENAREHYLPHPQHELLKAEFVPLIEDIVVFDFSV